VVEQATRGPSPVVGPANCFANRYGRSLIRIQPQTMQLGLRFAAAKLRGLRTHRVVGNSWNQAGALSGQKRRSRIRGSTITIRQIRCTIKKGSAVKPWPNTRVGNLGSANQTLAPDGWLRHPPVKRIRVRRTTEF
jgi:hypothetical protein